MNEIVLNENGLINVGFKECKESFINYLDVSDKTLRAYKIGIEAFFNFLNKNNM
jgi:hypothetical protein